MDTGEQLPEQHVHMADVEPSITRGDMRRWLREQIMKRGTHFTMDDLAMMEAIDAHIKDSGPS